MLLVGILTYLVLFVGLVTLLVKIAPIAYEDQDGFHYEKNQKLTVNNGIDGKLAGIKSKAA